MSKKALFITSNSGIEHDELIKPLEFLKSKGIEAIHAAIEQKEVKTVKNDEEAGPTYQPDTTIQSVDPNDYDVLVIAGGTVNADKLRIDQDAIKIVQHFADQKKIVATICHGPWILTNAERVKDKYLTSYESVKVDLENAGGKWVNESAHRCNTNDWILISSRNPDDIPAFNAAILKELS